MSKRWTAYKVNISDVVSATQSDSEFILLGKTPVNRVRILGTVVSVFLNEENKSGFLILDDGTETIRLKFFSDIFDIVSGIKTGDIVDAFGRLRKYEDEIYVIPEIVLKIDDPNTEILRKIELLARKTREAPEELGEVEEETVAMDSETPRQKIISLLETLDKGEGVKIEILTKESEIEDQIVEAVLTDLMNEGEVFEPRAGKLKLLR